MTRNTANTYTFHNFCKNILLSMGAFIFFAVLLELVFRLIFGPPMPKGDPIAQDQPGLIQYTLIPNIDRTHAESRIQTNSIGLRELREPETLSQSRQILILGDSYTFGYGVEQNESYPAQLESLLNQASTHDAIAVINAGVPGYDTVQEHELLKKIIPHYSPEWIVVGFHPGDLTNPQSLVRPDDTHSMDSQMKETKRKPKLTFRLREFLRKKSSVFSWIFKFYKTSLVQYVPPPSDFLSFDPSDFISSTRYQITQEALLDIQTIAKQNKSQMAIFMVVPLIHWKGYPYRPLHEALMRFAQDHGIYFIDPLAEFEAYPAGDLWVFPNDGHYNLKANSIAAQSLAQFFFLQYDQAE